MNERLQTEMDIILVKSLNDVQPVYERQGESAAKELINLIALGIKQQLMQKNIAEEYAEEIEHRFIEDMNTALFEPKH